MPGAHPAFGPIPHPLEMEEAADTRLAGPRPPLTAEELEACHPAYIEHLLYAAIAVLKAEDAALILATQAARLHLNMRRVVMREGSLRVTFLSFACLQVGSGNANATARKLAIVHNLLNAGAFNVNVGYSLMGTSHYTPMQAACDARLWPGITEAAHRGLLQRLMACGGQPNARNPHPLAATPREVAEQHAPYLLPLLPDNQENDGQLALFKAKEAMPRQPGPAALRGLTSPPVSARR